MVNYTVHCGDLHQAFVFNSRWNEKTLHRKFSELLKRIEFVPGLILQDEDGNMWKPKLSVRMEPTNRR